MAKEKKGVLPDFPLPGDPLEALERFNSVIADFQNAVDTIDGKLGQIDKLVGGIDRKFRSPTKEEFVGFVTHAKPKPHTHLSYEGQSELDYCLECCAKHAQTAKILMREAIQRAQSDSPVSPGVMEKVRVAIEELCGFEDDTNTLQNEKVATLNDLSRTVRKYVYTTRAEVGGANLEELREIKDMINKLVDASYAVMMSEEGPCIGCTTEELCGGNIECIEFVEKAAESIKDPQGFKQILNQAWNKYGKGKR